MKRVLLTGSNGLMGSYLIQRLSATCSILGTDLADAPLCKGCEYVKMDVTKREEVVSVFSDFRPDCVVNAAAFTDVDGCEVEREKAWSVNVNGLENVLVASREVCSSFVVHISTDFVFDGQNGPYGEDADPSPISFYGMTKLAGEKLLTGYPDSAVVRTAVLYGYHPKGMLNFATWVVQNVMDNQKISVVIDQFNTPTFAGDLVKGIGTILQREARGLFHIAGPEFLSRYDFAHRVADAFGLDKRWISPIMSDELHLQARRPMLGGLRIELAQKKLGYKPLSVDESLVMVRDRLCGKTARVGGKIREEI